MRVAFDTSVLVAALIEPHPRHARALPWLEAVVAGRLTGECSWHALAETWSVLTRLPIEPSVSPAVAGLAVERLASHLKPRELAGDDYLAAMRRCCEHNLRSGALFDAVHLIAAERSGTDALLTFNAADFERLAAASGPAIVVPPDPPAVVLPRRRPQRSR